MPEDPGTVRYRRLLVAFVLFMGLVVAGIGVRLLWTGRPFYAFLALLVLGFLVLLVHGYRQEEEERR